MVKISAETIRNIVLSLMIAGYCITGLVRWRSHFPWDFYQFWVAGQAIKDMQINNLYSREDLKRIDDFYFQKPSIPLSPQLNAFRQKHRHFEFFSTPFFYALFRPFSTGDFDADYRHYQITVTLCFIGAVVGLGWMLRYSYLRLLLILILLTRFSWPFQMLVSVGNIAGFQVGCLAIALWCLMLEKKVATLASGIILGALMMFKPNTFFIFPLLCVLWILERRIIKFIQCLVGICIGVLVGFILPSHVFGSNVEWSNWYRYTNTPGTLYNSWTLTGGFPGKLIGLQNVTAYGYWGIFLFLVFTVWVAWIMKFGKDRVSVVARWNVNHPGLRYGEFTMVGMGTGIYLMSGPIVHSHYFVLLVPLILLVMRPRQFILPNSLMHQILGGIALFLIGFHPTLKAMGLTEGLNHSLWTFLGVSMIMGLACVDFYQCRQKSLC